MIRWHTQGPREERPPPFTPLSIEEYTKSDAPLFFTLLEALTLSTDEREKGFLTSKIYNVIGLANALQAQRMALPPDYMVNNDFAETAASFVDRVSDSIMTWYVKAETPLYEKYIMMLSYREIQSTVRDPVLVLDLVKEGKPSYAAGPDCFGDKFWSEHRYAQPLFSNGDWAAYRSNEFGESGRDPIHSHGIAQIWNASGEKVLYDVHVCCGQKVPAEGCWIDTKENQKSDRPLPRPYQLWPKSGTKLWNAMQDSKTNRGKIRRSLDVLKKRGSSWLDIKKYDKLDAEISVLWESLLSAFSRVLIDYRDALDEAIALNQEKPQDPASMFLSAEEISIVRQLLIKFCAYNKIFCTRDSEYPYSPEGLRAYLNKRLFHVSAATKIFTPETRGGFRYTDPDSGEQIRIQTLPVDFTKADVEFLLEQLQKAIDSNAEPVGVLVSLRAELERKAIPLAENLETIRARDLALLNLEEQRVEVLPLQIKQVFYKIYRKDFDEWKKYKGEVDNSVSAFRIQLARDLFSVSRLAPGEYIPQELLTAALNKSERFNPIPELEKELVLAERVARGDIQISGKKVEEDDEYSRAINELDEEKRAPFKARREKLLQTKRYYEGWKSKGDSALLLRLATDVLIPETDRALAQLLLDVKQARQAPPPLPPSPVERTYAWDPSPFTAEEGVLKDVFDEFMSNGGFTKGFEIGLRSLILATRGPLPDSYVVDWNERSFSISKKEPKASIYGWISAYRFLQLEERGASEDERLDAYFNAAAAAARMEGAPDKAYVDSVRPVSIDSRPMLKPVDADLLSGKELVTPIAFKWEDNSCWLDSVLLGLFKLPRGWPSMQVYNAEKVWTSNMNTGDDDKIRKAYLKLWKDIRYIQGTPDQVLPPKKDSICETRQEFSRDFLIPSERESYVPNGNNEAEIALQAVLRFVGLGDKSGVYLDLNSSIQNILRNNSKKDLIAVVPAAYQVRQRPYNVSPVDAPQVYGDFTLLSVIVFRGDHFGTLVRDPSIKQPTKRWWMFTTLKETSIMRRLRADEYDGDMPMGATRLFNYGGGATYWPSLYIYIATEHIRDIRPVIDLPEEEPVEVVPNILTDIDALPQAAEIRIQLENDLNTETDSRDAFLFAKASIGTLVLTDKPPLLNFPQLEQVMPSLAADIVAVWGEEDVNEKEAELVQALGTGDEEKARDTSLVIKEIIAKSTIKE